MTIKAGHIFDGHRSPVYDICCGPLPATFLSGGGDGLVVRWDLSVPGHGELMVEVGLAIFSLYHDSAKALLLIGNEGGGIHVVDLKSKKELQLIQVHSKGVFRIIPLPGDFMAGAGGDGSLSIWKYRSAGGLELYRQIPVVEEKLRDLAISPDGSTLAVACGDGSIRLFDTHFYNQIDTIEAHPGAASLPSSRGTSSVQFHPHKPILISGGKDGCLRFWRTDGDRRMVQEIAAHKGGIYRVRFNRNGTYCASCSRDGTIKVWDPRSFDLLHRIDRIAGGHTHSVNALLWAKEVLISASDDRKVRSWMIEE